MRDSRYVACKIVNAVPTQPYRLSSVGAILNVPARRLAVYIMTFRNGRPMGVLERNWFFTAHGVFLGTPLDLMGMWKSNLALFPSGVYLLCCENMDARKLLEFLMQEWRSVPAGCREAERVRVAAQRRLWADLGSIFGRHAGSPTHV
jgi:hypothetical protein